MMTTKEQQQRKASCILPHSQQQCILASPRTHRCTSQADNQAFIP